MAAAQYRCGGHVQNNLVEFLRPRVLLEQLPVRRCPDETLFEEAHMYIHMQTGIEDELASWRNNTKITLDMNLFFEYVRFKVPLPRTGKSAQHSVRPLIPKHAISAHPAAPRGNLILSSRRRLLRYCSPHYWQHRERYGLPDRSRRRRYAHTN